MTAALVACGIDPDKSVLFNQTQVPRMPNCNGCSTAPRGWAG
jgi:tryptophanyl-tRNA synthetase